MKVTGIEIKNIGILEDVKLNFDKPLLLFYGDLRQGKSTLLKAFKWAVGGTYPAGILRHGETDGAIIIRLDNGSITRSWYVGTGGTTARDIQFIKNGVLIQRPAAEIKKLLNPFITDPEYLAKLSDTDRRKYFVELFNVDTNALDCDVARFEQEAQQLRAEIKGYGDIDLTEYPTVDLVELRARLAAVRQNNSDAVGNWQLENHRIRTHNDEIEKAAKDRTEQEAHEARLTNEIGRLMAARETAISMKRAADAFLAAHSRKEFAPQPLPDPTHEIEAAIEQGAAQNVRAEQTAKAKARLCEKQAKQSSLCSLEHKLCTLRTEKIAALGRLSDSCGVPTLRFLENGNFIYEGVQSEMLSTSQVMKLSAALSGLYPEGLSVTLLDRAECLGKSIFEYVESAKRDNKTVLAAIVGERPAEVPAEVGVFVVENGKVSQ